MTINKIKLLKIAGLLSVLPFLIGHGLGCVHDCGPKDYDVIGGTPEQTTAYWLTSLQHTGIIKFRAHDKHSTETSTSGPTSSPIDIYTEEHKLQDLHIVGKSENSVGALGEVWTYQDAIGKLLKIMSTIHNTKAGEFIRIRFEINDEDYGKPESSQIASGTKYVLSADASASFWMTVGHKATIYLNDEILLDTNGGITGSVEPIVFDGQPGDILRFEIDADNANKVLTPFWLHAPTGEGHKILHKVILRDDDDKLEVAFVLP